MSIGERIKELRIRRGFNQDQIAELLEMSRANFSHYERDVANPPGEVLSKIADILNTTTDYLLGRTSNSSSDIYDPDIPKEMDELIRDIQNLAPEDKDVIKMLIGKIKQANCRDTQKHKLKGDK